jgi:hypothetical protein
MMTAFLVAAVVLCLALAALQWRKACRARSSLNTILDDLPEIISQAVRATSGSPREAATDSTVATGWAGTVNYMDLDGDGRGELLVQGPTGAHGSELRILDWKDRRFRQVANLTVGTPAGFEFGDFDGDGKIEIKTQEVDWSTGVSYVTAPRLDLWFRWDGTGFIEVSRKKASSAAVD